MSSSSSSFFQRRGDDGKGSSARFRFSNVWRIYEEVNESRPFLVRGFVGCGLYTLSDVMAQRFQKRDLSWEGVSWERTASVSLWRALLHAPAAYMFFNWLDKFVPKTLGVKHKGAAVAVKIVLDTVLANFPLTATFIAWQSYFGPGQGRFDGRKAAERVVSEIIPTFSLMIYFWCPVHILTYGLIPLRHRQVWVNCAAVAGGVILSAATYDP